MKNRYKPDYDYLNRRYGPVKVNPVKPPKQSIPLWLSITIAILIGVVIVAGCLLSWNLLIHLFGEKL